MTKPESGANSAPARPAQAAESVKASVFTATGLSPTDSAATSESFTARIAAPQEERARRVKAKSTSAQAAMASSATPRSPRSVPKTWGEGTPMIPFWPPVSPRHSAAAFSTTKPKAMVTMAR